ncbi:hypothetical protein U9M48_027317, partial [Paspalum notatum var. saurae]
MLDPPSLPNNPKFIEMKYLIHTDEKWFNATKKNRNFYLLPNEEDPYRTVQNKNAMEKCMLFCGVGLPWFDDEGNCIFDGKIGIWPFVRKLFKLNGLNKEDMRQYGFNRTMPLHIRVSRNMDELIENVEKEFNEYDPCTLRRAFLTLQGCMLEVMKSDGGN